MYIKNLKLTNFKNFSSFEEDFKQINCIVGNNGVGKTNILDAIYYLSFCRGFMSNVDYNSIKHDEDFFAIFGTYQLNDDEQAVFSCSQKRGERKVFKYGKNIYKHLSEHIGKLPCVMVTPFDQVYIIGRSEERRRFMDMILSQTDVTYMDALISYNRALEQRNKLIKIFQKSGVFDTLEIEIYNDKLNSTAKIIQEKRREFFSEFKEPFQKYYNYISSNKEQVNVEYKTYEGNLIDNLHLCYEKDKAIGYTTQGIHRDDLVFFLNDYNVHYYGSQGQQKTFLLALKLAQYSYLKDKKQTTPILLLDDIFDKFDFTRVEKILSLVGEESFGQVFITDTHQDRVEKIIPENKKDDTRIIHL